MKVLISRTDAIGDTLLTLPMVKLIKSVFPEAKVAFLVTPQVSPLLELVEDIDAHWVFSPSWSPWKKFLTLRRIFKEFGPSHFFFVGGSHWPSFYAFLKRTLVRSGLKSKWASFLFLNQGIRQSRSIVTMHESEYNLGLLETMGITYKPSERERYRIFFKTHHQVLTEVKKELEKRCQKEGIDFQKEIVIIHPGMTGHTLNWSGRNYGRLIARLEAAFPDRFLFVVSYTPSDEEYLVGAKDYINNHWPHAYSPSVLFINGKDKGLVHYVHLVSMSSLFIGPSTGTTHIANSLNIPQVGLYSPIKVQSALRWGPFHRGDKVSVLVPEVVCGEQFKCAERSCPYFECMAKIEVDDVVQACQNVLMTKDE
jgi:heptosyltransferase III